MKHKIRSANLSNKHRATQKRLLRKFTGGTLRILLRGKLDNSNN